MTASLLRLCAVDRCRSLFQSHDYFDYLTLVHYRAPVARARLRRRSTIRAPSTRLLAQKRRRFTPSGSSSHSLQKLETRMASQQEVRRRYPGADRTAAESIVVAIPTPTTTSTTITPATVPGKAHGMALEASGISQQSRGSVSGIDASMISQQQPPPPPPSSSKDIGPSTQLSRSDSTSSRITNRLSLTLPIAPPTSDPSRPASMSTAAATSMPMRAPEKPAASSPTDANEFIIAIAAQERRVLEIREELARAEAHLVSLKKQWASKEAYQKKSGGQQVEPDRDGTPFAVVDDPVASRRSVEMDRRKMLLQGQAHGTPTQNRRRVMRGGHTRTLSLLSPASTSAEFSVHEDAGPSDVRRLPVHRRPDQFSNPALLKRASWQPRSARSSPAVPQFVEDFRLGLQAFVEDIRQITVGDEPITGQRDRIVAASGRRPSDDGRMSRSGSPVRPRGKPTSDPCSLMTSTPTPASRNRTRSLEKLSTTKSKHYSLTPLGFDSLDDSDWANWDSSTPAKSPRWSGSTMNSAGRDDIGPILEVGEENATPVKLPTSAKELALLSPKLEELLPSVVNKLSPSNLKRTANNLLDEWEKSLTAPGESDKENKA
ncbi:hypothetical protein RJ55_05377 [Drechmeria coniospora]|nr:hypothetical protein RJ55_05377 [Drechmeria coniospora]